MWKLGHARMPDGADKLRAVATIVVLGAGMMGSALCVPLVDAGHEVRLVGTHLDSEIVESLRQNRMHPKLLLELPAAIEPFSVDELARAMRGADLIALGVSSAGVRWAAAKLKPLLRTELPILMIAKGLEWLNGSLRILPDVLRDELSSGSPHAVTPVAVGGPCIAGELARRVETCVVFGSRDRSRTEALATLARTPYYHVTTSSDVVGVEACAALKNAYAMGIAFAQGIHERRGGKPGSVAMHNHEAAVFAQSVLEMQRVVAIMGGDPATAVGLAGVGDLDVTCNGGRTGRFGKLLGSGIGVAAAIEQMAGATLECLEILGVLRSALAELEARGVLGANELPLLRQLMEVALDDAPPDLRFERFFDQSGVA